MRNPTPGFVPIHSLAFFRIVLGAILAIEGIVELGIGHVDRVFIEPAFHFTFPGFGWVHPLPGAWMYVLEAICILSVIGFSIGLFFRASAFVLFITYSWKFLIDSAWYLNHHYLVILLILMFLCSPAARYHSFDAKRNPRKATDQIPRIWRTAFLLMLTVVYFYAGLAKLNPDWLNGEPMRTWLSSGGGHLLSGEWMKSEFFAMFLSYGGLAFDLTIPFFLLWRKTRTFAFGFVLFFHFSNFLLFEIGIFPWTMLVASTLYFRPEWPEKWLNKLKLNPEPQAPRAENPILKYALIAFLIFNVVFPFRYLLYPGVVHWTEEGHNFAWHMMLRSKRGSIFYVVEDSQSEKKARVSPLKNLKKRQYRKLAVHPDKILQYAHHLRDSFAIEWGAVPRVYAFSSVSLNARPAQPLVDSGRDLGEEEMHLGHYDWIVPLKNWPE